MTFSISTKIHDGGQILGYLTFLRGTTCYPKGQNLLEITTITLSISAKFQDGGQIWEIQHFSEAQHLRSLVLKESKICSKSLYLLWFSR